MMNKNEYISYLRCMCYADRLHNEKILTDYQYRRIRKRIERQYAEEKSFYTNGGKTIYIK